MRKQHISLENGDLKFDSELGFHYKQIAKVNKNELPIAVLIGPETASSGEFIALALKRQPKVILIGKASNGVATVNEAKSAIVMPDIQFDGSKNNLINLAKDYIGKNVHKS